MTYLKRDMIIPDTNLEFLFPNNIFFWPICVVFSDVYVNKRCLLVIKFLLRDFACLHYSFELFHHQGTDPH